MFDAVTFDLFETLISESGATPERASSLADRLGLESTAYRTEWKRRRRDVVLGRCTLRDALAETTRAVGGDPHHPAIDAYCADRVAVKASQLRSVEPAVLRMLHELRSRGLMLALISNCFAEDVAGWSSSPLAPLFDESVFSCAVGLAKPDPRIYEHTCALLNLRPARVLFVGDGGDDELAGAERAGLHSRRALWYLTRWPGFDLPSSAPGLREIHELLGALERPEL